jgi:bacteriocin-like protein
VVVAKEVLMTRSKKPNETLDALLDADSKDGKITKTELSEEELKSVSGGKHHVSNIKWTPGRSSTG